MEKSPNFEKKIILTYHIAPRITTVCRRESWKQNGSIEITSRNRSWLGYMFCKNEKKNHTNIDIDTIIILRVRFLSLARKKTCDKSRQNSSLGGNRLSSANPLIVVSTYRRVSFFYTLDYNALYWQ